MKKIIIMLTMMILLIGCVDENGNLENMNTIQEVKQANYSQYAEINTNTPNFAPPTDNSLLSLQPIFVRKIVEEDGTVINVYWNRGGQWFWADVKDKKLRDYSMRGLGTQIKMELGLPY